MDKFSQFEETSVDLKIVEQLSRYEAEIEALDKWIEFPDRLLAPKLLALSEAVKAVYGTRPTLTIYRGLHNADERSAKLGLGEHNALGEEHRYTTNGEAISFTTDLATASKYGSVVIRAYIDEATPHLEITPELYYLVSKRRGLKHLITEHEVVVLPGAELHYEIISKKRTPYWERR